MLLGFLALFVAFSVVLIVNALLAGRPKHKNIESDCEPFMSKQREIAQRLSALIRCRTVTHDSGTVSDELAGEYRKLHRILMDEYPLVHHNLERHCVNEYSLVYIWRATKPVQKPIMFAAHMDVVPIPNADKWNVPPFDGLVDDTHIWGRGSIDDKQAIISIFEALSQLIRDGFTPQRDLYICLGHDEEIGGYAGASNISKWLEARGVSFEFVLDEGLFVLHDVMPGHKDPVALVCVSEKGSMTVELSVDMPPGHSSVPERESAIGVLAGAVQRLEQNPMPTKFAGPAEELFKAVLGGMSFPFRLLFGNMWLTRPLIARILSSKAQTATIVRTTTAVTVFRSGEKHNVIPGRAVAIVNHRVHPQNTLGQVLEHDRRIIADSRVQLNVLDELPAAPVSSTNTNGWHSIERCVNAIFPSATVAPSIFIANSDTRHYWDRADNIYRFCPTEMHGSETGMFHGIDERMKIRNLAQICAFYHSLAKESLSG